MMGSWNEIVHRMTRLSKLTSIRNGSSVVDHTCNRNTEYVETQNVPKYQWILRLLTLGSRRTRVVDWTWTTINGPGVNNDQELKGCSRVFGHVGTH